MPFNMKRAMIEKKIKHLKQQLEEITAKQMQTAERPIEDANDTRLMVSFDEKKKKLPQELKKLEQELAAGQ